MDYLGGASEIRTSVGSLSRLQDKEELQRLNDRFSAYAGHVRQLVQQSTNVDMSAFMKSTKILDEEITNLKNIYETELEKLRKDIEAGACERHTLQVQCKNQQKNIEELQNKLSVETDRNRKLLDNTNVLQRKIGDLDSELRNTHIVMQQPQERLEQLQKCVDNLTREVDQWKHRCEQEQLATQDVENRLQQMLKKIEFSDQVHDQQIKDYKARLDMATTTILNLEAHVQELNTTKVPINELLKQVREKTETELRNYQVESEELYAKNLSALKSQIDSDADTIQRLSQEKSELIKSIGELQAKIRNLEGQVASLQHQKKTLEDTVTAERNQAANNIRQLEKKLRDVQDILVVKMSEIINVRESSIPLKSEIEALKALLEEEEKRLQVPLGTVSSSAVQTTVYEAFNTNKALTTTSSEGLQKKEWSDCTPATENRNRQALADTKKTGGMSEVATTSQLLASSSWPAVTSVPVTSYVTTDYDYSSSYPYAPGISSVYPYELSSPLDTFYIPEELQSGEEDTFASNVNFDSELTTSGFRMPEILLPMTGPQYNYRSISDQTQCHAETSPPLTSRAIGPIQARAKSAPGKVHHEGTEKYRLEEAQTKENDRNINTTNFESSFDYKFPGEISQDLKKDTVVYKLRPKSSPLERMPSFLQDYTDSASSAIGDLKVMEVGENGKYVRLLNDGPTEFELGGYMIQQFVGGHPVAVYRFPQHTKFPSDSKITVWSAMNDPKLHNPPTDFFWKEKQKWETGPNCTTVLCTANGQAVAWATSSHRFTKDAFLEASKANQNLGESYENKEIVDDEGSDSEIITQLKVNFIGPKPEPVFLRREKKQPPSLFPYKHPHGKSPTSVIHPHTGQPRPLCFGNDNSTYSRQSRTQTVRPDPIPGQPYTGAPAQRIGSKTSRTTGNGHSSAVTENVNVAKKSATTVGETCEGPSPFMRPHGRFETGLKQVCSQHHPDFLPPMPRPPQITC